jgi:hypothetical protein
VHFQAFVTASYVVVPVSGKGESVSPSAGALLRGRPTGAGTAVRPDLDRKAQIGHNRRVPSTQSELTDQRLFEAHKAATSRRWRIQRRHYERDTRRDVDAAGTKIERHHRSELA